MSKKVKEQIKNSLMITVGCILYSASLSLLLSPASMAPGGISGLAIVINRLIPISVGMLTFLLNVPLFIIGFIKLGKKFMIHTITATAASSVMMDLIEKFVEYRGISVPLTSEPILDALFGGALMGFGIGLIMRGGGSSGGTDIIARVLRLKYKHIKTGTFFIMIDALIIAVSALVFKNINLALYAALADIMASSIIDRVIYGNDEAKLLLVVSDSHKEICDRMMRELDTGATYLEGTGGYTGQKRRVVMCALHKSQFTRAREIIREVDENAFLIVTTASEVFGEGYKMHYGDDL